MANRTDWKTWALGVVMGVVMLLAAAGLSSFDRRLEAAEKKVVDAQVDIATLQSVKEQLNRMEITLKEVKDELATHMEKQDARPRR